MAWTVADIALTIVGDGTDDPVATATIDTPAGRLWVMAEPEWIGRSLRLRGVHLHGGPRLGPNRLGAGGLRRVALLCMEMLDVDELVVEGEIRTTGAGPGRRPRALRFTRALPSDRA